MIIPRKVSRMISASGSLLKLSVQRAPHAPLFQWHSSMTDHTLLHDPAVSIPLVNNTANTARNHEGLDTYNGCSIIPLPRLMSKYTHTK